MRLLAPLAAALLLFPLAGARPARHAYHSTLTELRYNPAKKQLELSVKVFADDIEKAISQGQPKAVSLAEPGPRPLVLADAYFQRTLQISTVAGARLPMQVLGMQPENDGYWFYCKVPLPGPVRNKSPVLVTLSTMSSNVPAAKNPRSTVLPTAVA